MFELSRAKDPSDAALGWLQLRGEFPELKGIVALDEYDQSVLPASIKKYLHPTDGCLVSYFSNQSLYFLEDQLLFDMFTRPGHKFGVDYTIMFDTNIATYIDAMVRGESLGNVHSKVVPLIDDLLRDDLNFDHLYYMMENVKIVHRQVNKSPSSSLLFWRSLHKDFRRNLVSLELFRSINTKDYKRTLNPIPAFSYWEAARGAVRNTYDFYVGQQSVHAFVTLQRLILLQLIGMVRIQLSSAKGPRKKMADYFEYVHNVVGVYFDRETIIAHRYFADRRSVGIFEKIKLGVRPKQLLKRLDNIAWDMAAPRFMEQVIAYGSDAKYFVPFFLTLDANLRELLRFYRVKGAVYSKEIGFFAPIAEINTTDYFHSVNCGRSFDRVQNDDAKRERASRPKHDRQSLHSLIKREYSLLRALFD